jgi:hypothetical protein
MSWRKGTFLMTAAVAGLGVTASALADDPPFSDDFESYTVGQPLSTQSPDWEPWCPNGPDGLIQNGPCGSKAYRQDSSVGSSDTVHRIVATTGQWELSAWVYHPSSGDGTLGATYWIVLNQYVDANCLDLNNWSAQVNMNSSTATVTAEANAGAGGTNTPQAMVFDDWVKIELFVDLNADQADLFYGGLPLHTDYIWSQGVSGGGLPTIECLDLFTFGGTLYWDNVYVGPTGGGGSDPDTCTGGPLCMTAGDWTNNSTETGTVANTCDSDDSRTTARRGTFTPAATALLRYDASTNYSGLGGVTSITVSAECSISNAGVTNVTGRLQIKNQVTGVYATVGSALRSATDSVISGSPTGDPNQYIGTNGLIEVRLVFQQTSGGPNWDGRIDQLTVDVQ